MNKKLELSSADLVVLSLLAEEPMHGYKIVYELEVREAKDWAPVSKPQVYYSIKKLLHLNFINSAKDTDEALGPDREVFKINAKGFKAMNESLSQTSWAKHRPPPPFMTWMALSSHISAKDTLTLIKERREFLLKELQKEEKTLAEFENEEGFMSVSGKLMVALSIEQFKVELKWLDLVEKDLPRSRK